MTGALPLVTTEDYTHPREGTETFIQATISASSLSIILIPARGRKRLIVLKVSLISSIILIPARGRKRISSSVANEGLLDCTHPREGTYCPARSIDRRRGLIKKSL